MLAAAWTGSQGRELPTLAIQSEGATALRDRPRGAIGASERGGPGAGELRAGPIPDPRPRRLLRPGARRCAGGARATGVAGYVSPGEGPDPVRTSDAAPG